MIIKLGCNVKQSLHDLAATYNDTDIKRSLRSNPAIIELGQHAKLKGAVRDAVPSLHVLVGTVLKRSFSPPTSSPSSWESTNYIQQLHTHIESIWQVYHTLSNLDSVGLPLVPFQIQKDGHLVTLFQGNKPVAEGRLVWPHPRFIKVTDDDNGGLRQINITPTRSLIELTKVLTPGCIHSLHSQSIQWIFDHGARAVVTTSTLRTRNETPPAVVSSTECILGDPAPLPPYTGQEPPFTLSIPSDGETWSQDIDEDEDVDEDVDEDDNGGFELVHDCLGEKVMQIPMSIVSLLTCLQ